MTTISGVHVIEAQDLIEQLSQFHPTTKVHIVLHHEGDFYHEDDEDLAISHVAQTEFGLGLIVDIPRVPNQN